MFSLVQFPMCTIVSYGKWDKNLSITACISIFLYVRFLFTSTYCVYFLHAHPECNFFFDETHASSLLLSFTKRNLFSKSKDISQSLTNLRVLFSRARCLCKKAWQQMTAVEECDTFSIRPRYAFCQYLR